jgi:OmpA-OmpF porin, OOP family
MEWWKNADDDDRQEYLIFALLGLAALSAAGFFGWRHFHPKKTPQVRAAVPAIPSAQARLRADIEPHRVRLTGVVDSNTTRDKVLATAKKAFPKSTVEDQLLLAANVKTPGWLNACAGVMEAGHEVRWGHLDCSTDGIKLVGEVGSEDAKASTTKLITSVHADKPATLELRVTPAPKVDPDVLKADLAKHLEGKIVEFETGSDQLTATGRTVLDELVPSLKELEGLKIEVGGHTDNAGDPQKNVDLSDRRAKSVIAYLGKKGADTTHLTPKGYGDTKPKAPNTTPEGQKQNRRIEFDAMEVHSDH